MYGTVEFSEEHVEKLVHVCSFIVSVYAPMFLRIHNPRAPEGPSNMIFLRNILLDFKSAMGFDYEMCESLTKAYINHSVAWLNPTNVAVSAHSANGPLCTSP